MAITINSGSTPSTIVQQTITQAEGSLINSITKNIKNPVLAGAGQSLLNAIFGNTSDSAIFQEYTDPNQRNWDSSAKVSNFFSELDQHSEFSKSCRFLVDIPLPRCFDNNVPIEVDFTPSSLRLACHTAEIPGVNLRSEEHTSELQSH